MFRYAFVLALILPACSPMGAQTTPSEAADKPLPEVAALLDAVEKHEDRDEALLQQYTYRAHFVGDEFDSKDSVKKTTSKDFDSIPINGVRVDKLIAKDGQPLTADEQKKASSDFDKAVESAKKRKAKYEEKKAQAEREGKSNDGFLPASRILQLGTFSNERRVEFHGRPTIVLDFTGTKGAKTRNEFEKVVEDLAGTVWIDEQDKVIARAEGHFVEDFKIGFGLLADIHKGLSFTVEQQKINSEVWLPRSFDGRGKASVGVFLRVHGHSHTDMSDYRKMKASVTLLPGSQVIGEDGKPIPDPVSEPEAPAVKPK